MPIDGVTREDFEMRMGAFREGANRVEKSEGFRDLTVSVEEVSLQAAVESYFFLSAVYKEERILLGSRTRLPKIAAMTALAIGNVQPIRPPSLSPNLEEYLYVNGAMAMRLACALVRHRFDKRPFDDRRRWYRLIQGLTLPSLRPIIEEANGGALTTTFLPSLTNDELSKIDALVDSFCIMERLGDHDAAFR